MIRPFFFFSFAAYPPQYELYKSTHIVLAKWEVGSYQDRSWQSHWLQNTPFRLTSPKLARQALSDRQSKLSVSLSLLALSELPLPGRKQPHSLQKIKMLILLCKICLYATFIIVTQVYNKNNHSLFVSSMELLMFLDKRRVCRKENYAYSRGY